MIAHPGLGPESEKIRKTPSQLKGESHGIVNIFARVTKILVT
jgi:hypothetical protein